MRPVMRTSFFHDLLATIAAQGRAVIERESALPAHDRPSSRPLDALSRALLSSEGEASGVALAEQVADAYDNADDEERTAFFLTLAEDFGPDRAALADAIAAYQREGSEESALALHAAAEPRRQELVRRINMARGGTGALVRMRADLRSKLRDHPQLRSVDTDFHHLLSSWFNRGFLVMRPIDWNTPAAVLAKIIRYEAVHAIRDWDDLRRRIDMPDRRCYAFFHPALLDEPLIFVEVALTQGAPRAIAPVLADDRLALAPSEADTAVFYSISNCQRGLAGVSFGNFLIKQVVEDLLEALPNLETFVTLSPVPGFRRWLTESASNDPSLRTLLPRDPALLAELERPDWPTGAELSDLLADVLMPLAAYYFLEARSRGRPVDPVARFHLGNGASLERINWLGDRSAKGLSQAAGLMVNYRYVMADIERNHEAFAAHGRVASSPQVQTLLPDEIRGIAQ